MISQLCYVSQVETFCNIGWVGWVKFKSKINHEKYHVVDENQLPTKFMCGNVYVLTWTLASVRPILSARSSLVKTSG